MMDEAEFIRRFKIELRNLLGEDYDDGYASDIVKKYWYDTDWPEGTPEGCARVEASDHGEE